MEEENGFTALVHRLEELAVGTGQKQSLVPGMKQRIEVKRECHLTYRDRFGCVISCA